MTQPKEDFFTKYFAYVGDSEAPLLFHRWAATSMIGALLGRQFYFPFGHSKIYPNQYVMLMGSPGTRKSTAIIIAQKLLARTGYTRFSADKTSKERFIMDLKQYEEEMELEELEALCLDAPAEVFVVADEFTDFVGNNNMEFITLLTKLWDCPLEYKHPKIHGTSVVVHQPTVSILSGNTPQGFALAFPPEAIGNGFLSRLLFVYGEPTGRKITFPAPPDPLVTEQLAILLQEIKTKIQGEAIISTRTKKLCDRLYTEFTEVDDHRFKHYSTRRFTHLLKISLILAAMDMSMEITEEHLLKANTLLHYTELRMPKALGEFGKSKYSDVANSIIEVLRAARNPVTLQELWKKVNQDLSKISELGDIIKNLQHAGKIQLVNIAGKQGFLPKFEQGKEWAKDLIYHEWLTTEEMH